MTKLDFKKDYKQLYNPPANKVTVADVPGFNCLMIDGRGDPNTSQEFQEAVEALYSLSYSLKFMLKKQAEDNDYSVAPLEGLWWLDPGTELNYENKDGWNWTLIIVQPDFITQEHFAQALEQVKKKKNLANLAKVRFEEFAEGQAIQIMHIGAFKDEPATIVKLDEFMQANNYEINGKHHEIYLSDFRKVAPEKLKTIIRHPVRRKV
jgi:hypothetical protein